MAGKLDKPIIIAGGGIGGLAAALALSLKGYGSIVLEQASEFGEIGAGIQLGPNVFRMFERLGLTEAINGVAWFPDQLIMRDAVTAELVTALPLDDAFRAKFTEPYGVIHRADIHGAILDACRASDLITLEASVKVTGYEQSAGGVTVMAEGGGPYEGAALIGADGLWSTIRETIVGDGQPIVSGHIAYRAVLPIQEVPDHLYSDSMIIWAGEKTHLVHYPLRRGELYNLVAVFHSDKYVEGWDAFGEPDELHERFAGTCANVRELLERIETWKMWVLCDREPVKEWSDGRVTLLGDAAHPMLQYLAAGAGMAIEDAVTLSDILEANDGDIEKSFLEYPAARYLRTGQVQVMARVYGEVYHAAGVVRELRNNMLSERTPEQSYDGMAWLYDGP